MKCNNRYHHQTLMVTAWSLLLAGGSAVGAEQDFRWHDKGNLFEIAWSYQEVEIERSDRDLPQTSQVQQIAETDSWRFEPAQVEECLHETLYSLENQLDEGDNRVRTVAKALMTQLGLDRLKFVLTYSVTTALPEEVSTHSGKVKLVAIAGNNELPLKLTNEQQFRWLGMGGILPNNPEGLTTSDICVLNPNLARRLVELAYEQSKTAKLEIGGLSMADYMQGLQAKMSKDREIAEAVSKALRERDAAEAQMRAMEAERAAEAQRLELEAALAAERNARISSARARWPQQSQTGLGDSRDPRNGPSKPRQSLREYVLSPRRGWK